MAAALSDGIVRQFANKLRETEVRPIMLIVLPSGLFLGGGPVNRPGVGGGDRTHLDASIDGNG
jgi:hypothetical protein